jgi:hypothetical protein
VTTKDREFVQQLRTLDAEGIRQAFLNDREARQTEILAATHGKHVPMPFAGLWAPYIDGGSPNDVFRSGDVLAIRESGSIRPLQPVFVSFKGDPVRHVSVYLGVAMAENPLLPALQAEAPAVVFWDGCEIDDVKAAAMAELIYLMPIIGYTTGSEPFYPVEQWPVTRGARCFISALQSCLDPVELLVIPDRDSIPLKPCADGGSEVH